MVRLLLGVPSPRTDVTCSSSAPATLLSSSFVHVAIGRVLLDIGWS
jgi:hypothetical protein